MAQSKHRISLSLSNEVLGMLSTLPERERSRMVNQVLTENLGHYISGELAPGVIRQMEEVVKRIMKEGKK